MAGHMVKPATKFEDLAAIYGRPMELGRPLYFHPVVSSILFLLFFLT